MEKVYVIRDRECGNIIDDFDTYEEALARLEKYEAEDKKDNIYVPDFYEIVSGYYEEMEFMEDFD